MQWELCRFFDTFQIPYKLNLGKHKIEMWNKSEILFGSSEKPDSLEGAHIDAGAWIDEAGLMPRHIWDVVERRIMYHQAPVLFTTVPYFSGWLKSDLYERWLDDPEGSDVEWIPCRTKDNLDYPEEEIEKMRAKMRPEMFEIFYEGNFARPYGMIYPEPEDEKLWIAPFDVPEKWPAYAGHDFGFTDPTTGVWGRLDVKGEMGVKDCLYLVAEYEASGDTIEDHVMYWKSDGLDFVDEAWGDSAHPEVWLRASHAGYPVSDAEKAVLYGINVVYDRMKTGRLRIFRGLPALIDYRARYVWETDSQDSDVLLDKPKKHQGSGHLMDALRYLCTGLIASGQAPAPVLSVRSRELGVE